MLAILVEAHGEKLDARVPVARVHLAELLAVSLDQNRKQAVDMATRLKASYPVLHDQSGDVGKLYDVSRMPVMVLIDRGGVVRDVFEGFRRGNEEQYLERVQALLRE